MVTRRTHWTLYKVLQITAFAILLLPETTSNPMRFKWCSADSVAKDFVIRSAKFSFVSILNSSNSLLASFLNTEIARLDVARLSLPHALAPANRSCTVCMQLKLDIKAPTPEKLLGGQATLLQTTQFPLQVLRSPSTYQSCDTSHKAGQNALTIALLFLPVFK